MKTINTKNNNVITCDCGNVIEFDKTDYILQKTDESGVFYAIGVKCPVCGRREERNPLERQLFRIHCLFGKRIRL